MATARDPEHASDRAVGRHAAEPEESVRGWEAITEWTGGIAPDAVDVLRGVRELEFVYPLLHALNEGNLLANAGSGTIMRSRKVTAVFFIRASRTSRVAGATIVSAAALLALTVTSLRSAPGDWPPFLRASDEYPVQIVSAVRRLWTDATFTRTVSADPAPVPLSFYLRFVDAPDLTAAAARHLRLTTYHVKVLGDDWYEADAGGGTHGVYRVLLRDGGRRVILSWGTHRGPILGTVGGSALTRLEFADDRGRAAQRLTVNVIIDHGVAAGITRAILPLFGWFVDRKLTEGFRTTAAAAAWAHAKPGEFCAWLGGAFTADRRSELVDVFDECAHRVAVRRPRASRPHGSAGESPAPYGGRQRYSHGSAGVGAIPRGTP